MSAGPVLLLVAAVLFLVMISECIYDVTCRVNPTGPRLHNLLEALALLGCFGVGLWIVMGKP
jgi:hypothetical protein